MRDGVKNCINLQTGQLLAPPADKHGWQDENALDDWFARNGVDAVAATGEEIPGTERTRRIKWGLTNQRMKAIPVGSERWDKAVPDDLAVIDPFYNPRLLEGRDGEPATFFILTRNGTRGVLQIVQINEQPASVRIRYKLLQEQ